MNTMPPGHLMDALPHNISRARSVSTVARGRLSSACRVMIYVLFLCSGAAGLIYQVVWVRAFANVFGNTIYSASLVIAVFMLGLGVGSYVVGAWADRRYAARPESLLHAYGSFELAVGALGLAISALLPRLGDMSALISVYSRDA